MFWLLDEINNTKIQDTYIFTQIFKPEYTSVDDNTIYKIGLDLDKIDGMTLLPDNFKIQDKKIEDYISFNSIEPIQIDYQIKIIGNLISYYNSGSEKIYTFIKKEKVMEQNKKKLVLNIEYKLVDNHKIPDLTSNSYDSYFDKIKFNIYKINDKILYIKEINKQQNSFRCYLLTQNIMNFNEFFL